MSGQPAWRWETIAAWARERFGLRRPLLELLARTRGGTPSPIAAALQERGIETSISEVARALNGMLQQGLVGRDHRYGWVITEAGRQALLEGGPEKSTASIELAAHPGVVESGAQILDLDSDDRLPAEMRAGLGHRGGCRICEAALDAHGLQPGEEPPIQRYPGRAEALDAALCPTGRELAWEAGVTAAPKTGRH